MFVSGDGVILFFSKKWKINIIKWLIIVINCDRVLD